MKIHGFVCSWEGHEDKAEALQENIGRCVTVTVINTEQPLKGHHPAWIHLERSAYFSAHWNKIVELLDGDILFQIQADAELENFEELFAKAEILFKKYQLGVYEPNVDYTAIRYNKLDLPMLEPEVYEVPKTDCTCWFVAKEVLRRLPPIDVGVNKYGFGVVRAIAALSNLSGKRCARDYSFTVRHPRGSGYDHRAAKEQMKKYLQTLDTDLQEAIAQVERRFSTVIS